MWHTSARIYLVIYLAFLFLFSNAAEIGCGFNILEAAASQVGETVAGIGTNIKHLVPRLGLTAPCSAAGIDIEDYISHKYKIRKLNRQECFLQETIETTTKELENRSEEERKEIKSDMDCFFADELPYIVCDPHIKNIIVGYRHSSIFYPGWERVQKYLSESLNQQRFLLLHHVQRKKNRLTEDLKGKPKDIFFKMMPAITLYACVALTPYANSAHLTPDEILLIAFGSSCSAAAANFIAKTNF